MFDLTLKELEQIELRPVVLDFPLHRRDNVEALNHFAGTPWSRFMPCIDYANLASAQRIEVNRTMEFDKLESSANRLFQGFRLVEFPLNPAIIRDFSLRQEIFE